MIRLDSVGRGVEGAIFEETDRIRDALSASAHSVSFLLQRDTWGC